MNSGQQVIIRRSIAVVVALWIVGFPVVQVWLPFENNVDLAAMDWYVLGPLLTFLVGIVVLVVGGMLLAFFSWAFEPRASISEKRREQLRKSIDHLREEIDFNMAVQNGS